MGYPQPLVQPIQVVAVNVTPVVLEGFMINVRPNRTNAPTLWQLVDLGIWPLASRPSKSRLDACRARFARSTDSIEVAIAVLAHRT
jgi:hypothetical protein